MNGFTIWEHALRKSKANLSEGDDEVWVSWMNSVETYLVGGFKHVLFSIIYGIILPIHYYFSEGLKPPTSYSIAGDFNWWISNHKKKESSYKVSIIYDVLKPEKKQTV